VNNLTAEWKKITDSPRYKKFHDDFVNNRSIEIRGFQYYTKGPANATPPVIDGDRSSDFNHQAKIKNYLLVHWITKISSGGAPRSLLLTLSELRDSISRIVEFSKNVTYGAGLESYILNNDTFKQHNPMYDPTVFRDMYDEHDTLVPFPKGSTINTTIRTVKIRELNPPIPTDTQGNFTEANRQKHDGIAYMYFSRGINTSGGNTTSKEVYFRLAGDLGNVVVNSSGNLLPEGDYTLGTQNQYVQFVDNYGNPRYDVSPENVGMTAQKFNEKLAAGVFASSLWTIG